MPRPTGADSQRLGILRKMRFPWNQIGRILAYREFNLQNSCCPARARLLSARLSSPMSAPGVQTESRQQGAREKHHEVQKADPRDRRGSTETKTKSYADAAVDADSILQILEDEALSKEDIEVAFSRAREGARPSRESAEGPHLADGREVRPCVREWNWLRYLNLVSSV